MNDERKALWKETYNKKVETMPVRQAASEADDVVREWDKRNMFDDQVDPLAICPSVDAHCHIKMTTKEPDSLFAREGVAVQFSHGRFGTITGVRHNEDSKIATIDVITFYGAPPVGDIGRVEFRALDERKAFIATVIA